MKKAPYTVPEGFFEKFEADTLDKISAIRRRRRLISGIGAALAAIVLGIFIALPSAAPDKTVAEADIEEQMLEIYEYDIFLTTLNL
ncbi:MAG: hypothetical protein IJU69_06360 [Bacteroidales bacterium]|nr:hypothetical protein [Bacteroidales bacterium]